MKRSSYSCRISYATYTNGRVTRGPVTPVVRKCPTRPCLTDSLDLCTTLPCKSTNQNSNPRVINSLNAPLGQCWLPVNRKLLKSLRGIHHGSASMTVKYLVSEFSSVLSKAGAGPVIAWGDITMMFYGIPTGYTVTVNRYTGHNTGISFRDAIRGSAA